MELLILVESSRLRDGNVSERLNAIRNLRKTKNKIVIPYILPAVNDKSHTVRLELAGALLAFIRCGYIEEDVVDALIQLYNNDNSVISGKTKLEYRIITALEIILCVDNTIRFDEIFGVIKHAALNSRSVVVIKKAVALLDLYDEDGLRVTSAMLDSPYNEVVKESLNSLGNYLRKKDYFTNSIPLDVKRSIAAALDDMTIDESRPDNIINEAASLRQFFW